jgi:hypothetical protein
MDTTFRIPGTLGPEISVRRSWLGSIRALVDGQKAQRRRSRGLTYLIPMSDGSTKELRLTGQWTGLRAIVDGNEIEIERRLRRWEIALTFLPLGLIVLGGLIGALFGSGAAAINARLARSTLRAPIRAVGMILISLVAAALYLGTAFSIAPVPKLTVGSCVNGIHEGVNVTTSTTRSVDCASPHENEVIASVDYSPSGAFPGQSALDAFATAQCPTAFESYVGVSFEQSSLQMIPVTPSDLTWAKGDRSVTCVVLTTDGSKLTGSVKGSQK